METELIKEITETQALQIQLNRMSEEFSVEMTD